MILTCMRQIGKKCPDFILVSNMVQMIEELVE